MTGIDYTTWRKGKTVRTWTYWCRQTKTNRPARTVIDVCPKCGRKGEKNQREEGAFTFTHKGTLTELIEGFPIFETTDECNVPSPIHRK